MPVIARDSFAAGNLVYAWPFPIGPECEVSCGDDEQVVMCPAWTVGDRLGPGRHLWRSPEPTRPVAAYFVSFGSVDVEFDMLTSFALPANGQPIWIRASGSVLVRCSDPGVLVAQFIGLPFDSVDEGIRRSVARSVERMVARLLTRRVVLAGTIAAITEPSLLPEIIAEIASYNPTAGAVFGVELSQFSRMHIEANDGRVTQVSPPVMPRPELAQPAYGSQPPGYAPAAGYAVPSSQPPQAPQPPAPAFTRAPSPAAPAAPPAYAHDRPGSQPAYPEAVPEAIEPSIIVNGWEPEAGAGSAAPVPPPVMTPEPVGRQDTLRGIAAVVIPGAVSGVVSGSTGGSPVPEVSASAQGGSGPVSGVTSGSIAPKAAKPAAPPPIPARPPARRSSSSDTLPPPLPSIPAPKRPATPAPAVASAEGSTPSGARLASEPSAADARSSIMAIGARIGDSQVTSGEILAKVEPGKRVLVPGPHGLMQSATVRQLLSGYYELEVGSSGETIWVPMAHVVPE